LSIFKKFKNLEISIGEILFAEKIAKTKNLLKLKVNVGVDELTIVSGIANDYNFKEIIGRKVCVLINLKPRKIKGIESQGMILMGKDVSGKLTFISPDSLDSSNGSKVH
jgi:methionyl-tRNA synthetase